MHAFKPTSFETYGEVGYLDAIERLQSFLYRYLVGVVGAGRGGLCMLLDGS